MAYKRKTWQEKLADDKGLPKVAKIEGKLSKRWGEGTFVVPAPLEVDGLMKKFATASSPRSTSSVSCWQRSTA